MKKRIFIALTIILTAVTAAACASQAPQDSYAAPVPTAASPTEGAGDIKEDSAAKDTGGNATGNTAAEAGKNPQTPATPEPSGPQTPETLATLPADLAAALPALWPKIDGSTATIPLTEALRDYLGGGGSAPEHTTTHSAFTRLIEKQADLIFVTSPSENELAAAAEAGVELEVIPVAKDALVFLVNTENPVENATLARLRSVYTGKTISWQALGGKNEAIIPYQRNVDSGSQTLMLKLLMEGKEPMPAPAEWRPLEMGALVEAVANYDNSQAALGYSVFYYVNNMYGSSGFKLLSIDGVKPARDTIISGEYPLTDYYYAVLRKDTPSYSQVRALVDWLLSDEGQILAAQAGYIPLRPVEPPEEGILPANQLDPIYLGETEESSGTGGLAYKGPEHIEEFVFGSVRRPLSDVFYDGFNYIEYINREIINQLFEMYYPYSTTSSEDRAKRSFSGIPNDYPHYGLDIFGEDLEIYFPADNPFFLEGRASFRIPLTREISPYGTQWHRYTSSLYTAGKLLPDVTLIGCRIDVPGSAAVTDRINEWLKEWTNGFSDDTEAIKLLKSYADCYQGPYWPLEYRPFVGQWQNCLSVTYSLSTAAMGNDPVLHTICFDLTTGAVINPVDLLPEQLPYNEARILVRIDELEVSFGDDGWPASEYLENYLPAADSVIDEVWFPENAYGDNSMSMHVTEPDGRRLQVHFRKGWDEGIIAESPKTGR